MTYPSFYLKHLTQKLFILHRAKLLRISKLSFPNGLLFAFFVVQTFASLSVQLHKNSIKSAHFPKKYGKCADFYIAFQSINPFPKSSSSMARAITLRLSAWNGSAYCLAFICSAAASTPPLLLNFSSNT